MQILFIKSVYIFFKYCCWICFLLLISVNLPWKDCWLAAISQVFGSFLAASPLLNFKQPVVQWVQDEPQSCPRHRGACCALPGPVAGPFEPGAFYRLLFKPRPRPSAVMSQHSRRQINDLVVAADEQCRRGCGGGTESTNISAYMFAQPNTYKARPVHSSTLEGHVLGRWGTVSLNVLRNKQHFKIVVMCLLEQIVWLQWRVIGGLSCACTDVALLLLLAVELKRPINCIYPQAQWKATCSHFLLYVKKLTNATWFSYDDGTKVTTYIVLFFFAHTPASQSESRKKYHIFPFLLSMQKIDFIFEFSWNP